MATIDDDRVEGWEIDGSMTSTTSVALSDDHSHQKINDPVKKQEILQRMEVAKGTKAIEVLTRVNQSMYRRGLDFHNIFNIHGSAVSSVRCHSPNLFGIRAESRHSELRSENMVIR